MQTMMDKQTKQTTGVDRLTIFDSVCDAMDTVHGTKNATCNDNQHWITDWRYESKWMDNKTQSEIVKLTDTPQTSTIQQINKLRESIESNEPTFSQPALRRKRRRGLDNGDEIDIDRAITGDMFCWEQMQRTLTPHKTISIMCNVSVSCDKQRHHLLPRGAALCALAEWLSTRNYNCEILCGVHTSNIYARGKNATWAIVTRLKKPEMPLDVQSIATALCEIGFVRGVFVKHYCTHGDRRLNHSIGIPGAMHEQTIKYFDCDVVCPDNILNERDAQIWLEQTIKQLSK